MNTKEALRIFVVEIFEVVVESLNIYVSCNVVCDERLL
jgi:hypothetical protein